MKWRRKCEMEEGGRKSRYFVIQMKYTYLVVIFCCDGRKARDSLSAMVVAVVVAAGDGNDNDGV